MNSTVFISGFIDTEFVVVARQNDVQQNTCDCCDSKCCQGNWSACDGKSDTIAESKTADEDDTCDDQVSLFGQVYFVFHHVTHTDCRNHTIQHKADTTDD